MFPIELTKAYCLPSSVQRLLVEEADFSPLRKFINLHIQCVVIHIIYVKVGAYNKMSMIEIMMLFLISVILVHETNAV